MRRFDRVVAGGGIGNLPVTWIAPARGPENRTAILEKENRWDRHQTGGNGGIIHSGDADYKPGGLKAKPCNAGTRHAQAGSATQRRRVGIGVNAVGKCPIGDR